MQSLLWSTAHSLLPCRYLLSVITAHVKKSEPELETVLLRIKQLSERESGAREEPKSGPEEKRVSAEEALKYVLFLVDVDRLYNVALGMYDFQLVLMVAERSQKAGPFPDPIPNSPILRSAGPEGVSPVPERAVETPRLLPEVPDRQTPRQVPQGPSPHQPVW